MSLLYSRKSLKILMVCTIGIPLKKDSLSKGSIGGSETAFMSMARCLANLGHTVVAYVPTESRESFEVDGVTYHDYHSYTNEKDVFDVAIYSRDITAVAAMSPPANHTVWWCHDMPYPSPTWDVQVGCMWAIDELFQLSSFQRDQWSKKFTPLRDKISLTINGVDLDLIEKVTKGCVKDPNKYIYTNRYERGLVTLLNTIWPQILASNPQAKLYVCNYHTPTNILPENIQELHANIEAFIEKDPSIVRLGNLNKVQLYREIATSHMQLYPTDYPEISCIAAMEAMACGTPIITTKRYALPETLGTHYLGLVDSDVRNPQDYFAKFAEVMKEVGENYEATVADGKKRAADLFGWDNVAKTWIDHFEEVLESKGLTPGDELADHTIAACYIVKNEEDNILATLKSCAPHVDEVHITDTGSTDTTLALIDQFKDSGYCDTPIYVHIYDGPIEFDEMRNFSVSHTTCEWILWMDADERLLGGEHLKKYARCTFFPGLIVRQHHFYIEDSMSNSFDKPVRFYRNDTRDDGRKKIIFVGVIHEHVEFDMNFPIQPTSVLEDVNILHLGYITESLRRKKVRERNLPMLMRDREKYPERLIGRVLSMRDLYHMFFWAVEQGTLHGSYLEKAIGTYVENFMELEGKTDVNNQMCFDEAFKYYQMCLEALNRYNLSYRGAMPFCAKINLGIAAGREPEDPYNGQKRWFLDEGEYNRWMKQLCDKSLNVMKQQLTYAGLQDEEPSV